jgi:hypothetical protein
LKVEFLCGIFWEKAIWRPLQEMEERPGTLKVDGCENVLRMKVRTAEEHDEELCKILSEKTNDDLFDSVLELENSFVEYGNSKGKEDGQSVGLAEGRLLAFVLILRT